ncbi:MAG: metallophosphoesterase [Actinobacteria bacterium]|nr:metallophosphoesterase [Actinomycetota bacterium]
MLWWILLGVLAVGLACVAYGVFLERTWFALRRYRLEILPPGVRPLSVLHLSDLHFTRGDGRKRRFVESLPQADLAIVTGDILGEPQAVENASAALRAVRGRLASLFVLGSNDYYAPKPFNYLRYFFKRSPLKKRLLRRNRWQDLEAALVSDGWEHLKNRRTGLSVDGTAFEVVGADDPHIHRQDSRIYPREHPERFGIAVVHSPDPAPELAALGWDLIVSGHTHGGQVNLPLLGALVTNCSVPRYMASGLVRLGDAYVHVSAGAGTSKYAPFRFLCRPEATVLELVPAPAAAERQASAAARSNTRA